MTGPTLAPPMGLIAELTHRCPLSCAYCSNPLELERASAELDTATWIDVLEQAAAIGVLHLHFTGGEPMARRDLPELVRRAAELQLYTNLITSGVLLDDRAMAALMAAGIDHIQLSLQDIESDAADRSGGLKGGHAKKLAAAERIRAAGLPLTLNFVIHRGNADRTAQMLALGETLGATRIEIAHTQYYGWGLLNRDALLPTFAQLETATAAVEAARVRFGSRIAVDYVVPDYFAARPKACMGGWAQRFINISPSGKALPCHAAETLPGFDFPSVRAFRLAEIWSGAEAFQRFRGSEGAPEACRSCERLEIDWGGCRCQAFALTGDAARMDPACALSPDHPLMQQAIQAAGSERPLTPRLMSARG
ncbi:MAG: pyrroloquinoline quinone biosynthesis protein PqqE [Caulobacteraceae bacterium]